MMNYQSHSTSAVLPQGSTLCALERYSFSDEAAQLLLDNSPEVQMQYAENIDDVWSSTRDKCYAVIPFENSSAGVVWPHLDRLIKEQDLSIVASVYLPISMCVGGIKGSSLDSVQKVFSHHKALDQSSNFLSDLRSLEERVHTASTVGGVKQMNQESSPLHIALASRRAIEAHGLEVLQSDVANLPASKNITQFFVVHSNGDEQLPNPDARHHAVLLTPKSQLGALARITSIVASGRIDLRSFHSRNVGTKEYQFFMEMFREGSPKQFDLAMQMLDEGDTVKEIRAFGSWDHQFSPLR